MHLLNYSLNLKDNRTANEKSTSEIYRNVDAHLSHGRQEPLHNPSLRQPSLRAAATRDR